MWLSHHFKQRRISFFCFTLISLVGFSDFACSATAAAVLNQTEDDYFSNIPNVISATRIRQPLTEAPSSVTVIDRHMIEASGAIEIADVMRLVPGIQVSYPQGNQIAVTYHGYSDGFPRKMQVLIDGRSVYQSSYADVDWLFIGVALEDIDRIEVVRGPNSPLYGANSVQGVINIITKQPYQDAGTHVGFTGGDLGTRNGIIRHVGSTGQLDYRVTATYEKANGLPGKIDSTDDGRNLSGLSFRGVLQKSLNNEIDIQIGMDDGRLGAGAEVSDDPPEHNKKVSANYQFINWRHVFNDGGDSQFRFYRNGYDSEDKYRDLVSSIPGLTPSLVLSILGRPDEPAELGAYNYKGERYDTEWQYNSSRLGKWRSMIGLGARLNRFKSPVLTNKDQWIDDRSSRIFANTEYRPTDALITGFGVMAEDSNQFGQYISPRVSINYLPTTEYSFRLSHTRTKRNPSLLEDNFNHILKLDDGFLSPIPFTDNLNPEPETITSTELGFIGYWWNQNLFTDVKIFREQTDDVIFQRRSFLGDPTSHIGNGGKLIVKGLEMQIKLQLGVKDFVSVQYANLSADSTLKRPDDALIFWPNVEASVPKTTISALASHSFTGGYEVSVAHYSISEMLWMSNGTYMDAYHRWDLRLAKHWDIGKNRLKAEFIAQNIGDDYKTFRAENIFETRYFTRLSISL